jgi:hypothetical protein
MWPGIAASCTPKMIPGWSLDGPYLARAALQGPSAHASRTADTGHNSCKQSTGFCTSIHNLASFPGCTPNVNNPRRAGTLGNAADAGKHRGAGPRGRLGRGSSSGGAVHHGTAALPEPSRRDFLPQLAEPYAVRRTDATSALPSLRCASAPAWDVVLAGKEPW